MYMLLLFHRITIINIFTNSLYSVQEIRKSECSAVLAVQRGGQRKMDEQRERH